MKKLEFKTSKGDFILIDIIGEESAMYLTSLLLDDESQIEVLGKVKNMTEEQFAEVVHYSEEFLGYIDYGGHTDYATVETSKESFESLVKSLGWYLWENPEGVSYSKMNDSEMDYRSFLSWHEAKSKTFFNPILLKKI